MRPNTKMLVGTFLAASLLAGGAAFASPPRPTPFPSEVAFAPRRQATSSLGEVVVGGWRNRQATIPVGFEAGRLTRLRLIVKEGDIGMKLVRVVFGNGQSLVTRMSGRMALIDLPGEARAVRSIEISAPGHFGRRARALVEVLGDRAFFPRHAMR